MSETTGKLRLSRRETMGAGLALGLAANVPGAAAAATGSTSLMPPGPVPPEALAIGAHAAIKGMRFGSNIAWGPPGADRASGNNPAYASLLKGQCSILVPENELKWQATRPDATHFDFRKFDAILAFAEAHGFAMRGHTLLWYDPKYFPKWLTDFDFGPHPARKAAELVEQHIRTITRRYRGRIISYDVVNEAIEPKTGELRRNSLANATGNDTSIIDLAFHTAREELPDTQLVYNDYMSWEGGENIPHRKGVLKLLEGFRKRGVPVNALGVQSHLIYTDDVPPEQLVKRYSPEWRHFLDEVTGMGYDLVITEMDVRDGALPTNPVVRDRAIAGYLGGYMDLMLSYPRLKDVLTWGMCDKYSWLQGFAPRKDGTMVRGCPYDASFGPKDMVLTLTDGFKRTAMRKA
ncbi:endo-1,4-beta-xylanase [Stakelama sediminis]|uniref:Beta-xylanase n=1 Tax=Stakelama sediminis TaxID=463200 RepID=A0A840YUG8_9SPHN|nr:endo-1,4-beta-xylanase [Stakelama sediminis]MBB5717199.1 endo-1,4-beta-xylanase [Stakelama sediminis]